MRLGYQSYLLVSIVLGSIACGRTDLDAALDNGGPVVPSPASCSAGWQPITAPRDEAVARGLTYRDGELYYFSEPDYTTEQIEAQLIAGGEPRVVTRGSIGGDMWLMGDQLNYGFFGNLWRVPVTGNAAYRSRNVCTEPSDSGPVFALSPSPKM